MGDELKYSPTVVAGRFSAPRMARYLTDAGGDEQRALELYAHQMHLSASLWQTIGHVEVVLRNAMNDALVTRAADWYDALALAFDQQTLDDVQKAKNRAAKKLGMGNATPGHIVAELNLGFWRFLLSRKYDRVLWTPYLHRAFPNHSGARQALFQEVCNLNEDRNAVAHHQRVSNPKSVQKRAVRIAGYVCADTAAWIDQECRAKSLIDSHAASATAQKHRE